LLLLLDMLLSQVLKLLLLLLLHLLSAQVVGFLLIRALALLGLLLFNALPLLVLLSMQVLQLLLMLLLELRIAVWWWAGLPSRRWPIVACIAGRLIGLHIRWRIVWPVASGRPIRLHTRRRIIRPFVTGRPVIRLYVGWRIVRPVIRICWSRRWRTIRALIVRALVGRLSIRPVSVRRAIGLHVTRPIGIRGWCGLPVILRGIIRLLPRSILVLRRYGSIARVLLRSSGPRGRGNPHCSLGPLLLLNLAHLRDREWSPPVLLNGGLLSLKSWRRRRRSALRHNRAVYDRIWRSDGTRPTRADDGLPRGLNGRGGCNDRSVSHFPFVHPHHVVVHGLSAGKRLRGSSGHRARNSLIYIGNVRDVHVFIDHHVVVVIVDDGGVHSCVRNVDLVHVGAAHSVRRHVNLTRP
jgi:hypothetical protein